MLVLRGVIGAIILFLGRELNFLFAAGMAALVALRLTPKLPATLPNWSDYAFMAGVAILAAWAVVSKETIGYYVSGFFAGGYVLMEWFEPGVLTFPILPFFVGSVIGAVIIGVFTEWALIVISSLIGAIYVTTLFRLSQTAETLVAGGLFVIGAIIQVILMRMQKE
ncbi:MAG TPA: hypothetical protein PKK96_10560 [Anaerolineales bacterium]|nr:hypothetical protein [Anaerolineales bacterium]HMR98529.1 hypothetical protein [Anaerolineales bacterium]HNQ93339.1 hypothetical protein [Anaerolineales bacterium]HNS61433.1 hypothetical protein [Anaerolineales bacterium]